MKTTILCWWERNAKRAIFGASLAACLTLGAATAMADRIDLQTFRTHSRLSIPLDPSVEPDFREVPGGFVLVLKGVELQDLYLNEELIEKLKDSRLKGVQFKGGPDSVTITGKWNFPEGDLAPADPSMERFQYRERSPAKLVIDFWPKTGPTVGALKRMKKAADRQAAIRNAESAAAKRRQKRVEQEKALALQEDVSRFCSEPLKDDADVFLPFYPFHEPLDFAKYLPAGNPDDHYQYLSPKEGSEDAKYVNLALDLYAKGNFGLVVKTLDLFEKERPKSIHQTDMRFLRANALRKLGHKDAAHRLLDEIREKNAGSPASLFAAIYLANEVRAQENHLQALERYLWISQNYPKHRLNWVFRMAAAEALYALKQGDRAAKEYEWVAENAPDAEARAEGAIRLGDAYLMRFQYDRALAAYFKAIETYPETAAKSASLQANRAEALYWLGQLDRAEEAFLKYRAAFPAHPSGWRATLRLGEIVGRKPGPAAIAQARARFLETVNAYPFSQGATIARMRLIPCGDHAGFTAVTAKEFFEKQAQEFTGGGEIAMDRYKEMRAMLRVRSLILFGDLVAAVDAAIAEREELSRKSSTARWIADMERQLFRKNIVSLLDEGKKFEALQFYDKRSAKIAVVDDSEEIESGRIAIDPDYLLRLSRAASELGLGELGSKISREYATAAGQFAAARGIASGTEDFDGKLRRAERSYTEAQALWAQDRKKNADRIAGLLHQVIDESPFSYAKEIMLGRLAEERGKFATALVHATRARLLVPGGDTSGGYEAAAVDQWIAKLQVASGNTRAAIETYRKLQAAPSADRKPAQAVNLGLSQPDGTESWILAEGDLLGKSGRYGEAAKAYEKAVNQGIGGNRALYGYANALSKASDGSSDKARALLEKVAGSETNDFWKELARKALASENQR